MTDSITSTTSADPRSLVDGDAVDYEETTYIQEDTEYCASGTDGRAVVGVTNDDGEVLLLVNDERSHAILPNCHVEDGDWHGVARRTVDDSTGIAIDIVGAELVRAVDHVLENEDEPRERTHHVLFRATLAADESGTAPSCDDPDWHAGWYDTIPVALDEDGDVLADIERFLP